MTYIIYNRADPNLPDMEHSPYLVFKDTLEEARDNFSWVSESLQPGEELSLISIDLDRGKLTEQAIKDGVKNNWQDHNVTVHDFISSFFSDEEWEDED